jgi:glutamine synthetase
VAISRFEALKRVSSRTHVSHNEDHRPVAAVFGENVFTLDKMRNYISKEAYKAIEDAIIRGKKINNVVAENVSAGLKTWAMERGATHVTHWFQPMTGLTAEKHDSFLDFESGQPIERFGAGTLIQQEPDASSFPNGGVRQTFEARGYTAWDPSSPAFIMEHGGGKTLCIPSIFVSYSGEALDKKTPLLRSIESLNKQATQICQLFEKNVKSVSASLGLEQEYFLIDKTFFQARTDLMATGRTVFGLAPAKGQQLDDHYFGPIKERVFAYMNDLEYESYRLGIPLKTRHNEVAPHQFECAPIFEEANLAVDHNCLLMDIMHKVAERHNLAVLFHEKPFAGVNGSGKHNNWSLETNTGKNLLSPGKSPQDNLQFLLFLTAILKGVYTHGDILRASIANSGNDHRLGANEAPPAIISVFLGDQLTEILNQLEKGEVAEGSTNRQMSFGISKIPNLRKDNTDRNRTSPFAFTGNKFEFRAVGSSANTALPVYVLNTVVAEALQEANKRIQHKMNKGADKKNAIIAVIREFTTESKNIRFEGNGYSEEWIKEAERRGLPNLKSSPDAFAALLTEKSFSLFETMGVLNRDEIISRYNVKIERFIKDKEIEANVAKSIARSTIIPVCIEYQSRLAESITALKGLLGDTPEVLSQMTLLRSVTSSIHETLTSIASLKEKLSQIHTFDEDESQIAVFFDTEIKENLDDLRRVIDRLENEVDNDIWPLPKYFEMLFLM